MIKIFNKGKIDEMYVYTPDEIIEPKQMTDAEIIEWNKMFRISEVPVILNEDWIKVFDKTE